MHKDRSRAERINRYTKSRNLFPNVRFFMFFLNLNADKKTTCLAAKLFRFRNEASFNLDLSGAAVLIFNFAGLKGIERSLIVPTFAESRPEGVDRVGMRLRSDLFQDIR